MSVRWDSEKNGTEQEEEREKKKIQFQFMILNYDTFLDIFICFVFIPFYNRAFDRSTDRWRERIEADNNECVLERS